MRHHVLYGIVLSSLLLSGRPGFAQTEVGYGSGPVDSAVLDQVPDAGKDEPGLDEAPAADAKQVLGWVENLRLMPGRILMKAKLDSGAKSSALHAENIEYFKKDGRDMVRFTVLQNHQDPASERFIYERPLVREVNIKLRYTSVRDERPAVRLEFCLAGASHNAVFSLTNRSDFNYPVLLGREFLKHDILVDSDESFTHRTHCPRQ